MEREQMWGVSVTRGSSRSFGMRWDGDKSGDVKNNQQERSSKVVAIYPF